MMRRRLFLFAMGALALAAPNACTTKDNGQATLPRDQLLDPETCKQCHVDHYNDWAGSMHAYASDDPVFQAMNKRGQRETGGTLKEFCVNCHAPMALREGATTDGLNLDQVPQKLKGVTCFFCHAVDDVQGTHNAQLHLSDDLQMRGPFDNPVANTAHHATYAPTHDHKKLDSSKLCGTCHDIVTPHGASIERTFQEWQATIFDQTGSVGATCGTCHMKEKKNVPIAQAPNVLTRNYHAHNFPALDVALTPFPSQDTQKQAVQDFLDSTLQTALCVSQSGQPTIKVIVDNVAAGHSWPSGATQDRRAWAEVIAFSGATTIFQSGAVPDGTPVLAKPDPDLWLLRDCMFDDGGKQVSMFWQAASVESNELLAPVTLDAGDPRYAPTHVIRGFPLSGNLTQAPDRVTLRIRIQPIGLDVLDDLVASGDLDKKFRDAMPTFDMGATKTVEWTKAAATDTFSDENRVVYACVSPSGLNLAADKLPAVAHTKCTP
jgi:hypothetical protein